MNILVATPYPPVLHQHGGGVRMFHNIRLLGETHSVHVLAFVEGQEERQLLKSLEAVCASVTAIDRVSDLSAHWFSLQPFMVREFGTPAMHQAVDETVRAKKIDVIQCEYLQMAQYRRRGVFSILTIHEVYSKNAYRTFLDTAEPWEKVRMFSRWMSMLNYEVAMCNAFDRVVTMTADDAGFLRSYARRANIRAIPIGIDLNEFRPASDASNDCPVQVVFVGNYRHPPNVEAAEFLLTEIAPHFPDIEFVVAGSHLPETFQPQTNVTFPGYVADTRQLFHPPNTLFVAPLFSGTGQRVKLLEAFAMRAPVVTTPLGAAGFPVTHGEHVMLAQTGAEFRAAISALVSSPDLRHGLAREARQMIERGFSWTAIGEQFLEIVKDGVKVRSSM
jgi:glycosyltransferase involved in cell wall biosynthesis